MKITLKPLFSKQNDDTYGCSLGCEGQCKIKQISTLGDNSEMVCPLSVHQVETCAEVINGDADVIFNISATGDGKSLAAYLPALLDNKFKIMGLYPTIELVEDQHRHLEGCYDTFQIETRTEIEFEKWCDRIYGAELAQKIKSSGKNKFQQLWLTIKRSPILLTNPDIFHLITHFQYLDMAYDPYRLVGALASEIDLWVFDEFHIFDSHQETAALNSLLLIKTTQQRAKKFLFTSATPNESFIEILEKAGLKIKKIGGKDYCSSQKNDGYRQIIQEIELEFVPLPENTLAWLKASENNIKNLLQSEEKGRGLIIVNSVALAGKIVRELRDLFGDKIRVEEISGRISKKERKVIQEALKNEAKPVLVVGTSAVDVGVDFQINLLIFESSDSATVIQRLGRLGRHSGFNKYQAFILIPKRTPWIIDRLEPVFNEGEKYSRYEFQEKIKDCFNAPQKFAQYSFYWGIKQVQGMLYQLSSGNKEKQGVMQPVKDKMSEYLIKIYPALESFKYWWKSTIKEQSEEETQKKTKEKLQNKLQLEIQEQLLSFRGSSDLQAGVWDNSGNNSNFYTYDLLNLLPYTLVEVIDRETFINQAQLRGHIAEEFPDEYIQVYLKINPNSWVEERQNIELKTKVDPDKLKTCSLYILSKISIINHPNSAEINPHLNRKSILTFLIPLGKNSVWNIKEMLYLKPTFGLYEITDLDNKKYACAFNHDALLLEALAQGGKLKKHCQLYSKSSFF
jgi:CRISPR-associated endonuclease/helicase Cas3